MAPLQSPLDALSEKRPFEVPELSYSHGRSQLIKSGLSTGDIPVWQINEAASEKCLKDIEEMSKWSTLPIGLWSDQIVDCGIPLPSGAWFIESYIARYITERQLIEFRDKYLTTLRSALPEWVGFVENDEGWKNHMHKDGLTIQRMDRKGKSTLAKATYNFGSSLDLYDYGELNLDRNFPHHVFGEGKVVKTYRPAVSWCSNAENPWNLTIAWICYHGLPPLISDREAMVISLVVALDENTNITIGTSVEDFPFRFPDRPKNAVPATMAACYKVHCLPDKTLQVTGVAESQVKLNIPQFIYLRSPLFTLSVDFIPICRYMTSERARSSLHKHPIHKQLRSLAKTRSLRDVRPLWFGEEGSANFRPAEDLPYAALGSLHQLDSTVDSMVNSEDECGDVYRCHSKSWDEISSDTNGSQ